MAVPNEYDREEPVVAAARGGDRYAFDEFVRRQDRWIRGVAFGVLGDRDRVDDVVQQVWTTVWERFGDLRDVKAWRSWLYRLARNAAVDAGREVTRRRKKISAGPIEDSACSTQSAPDAEVMSEEHGRAVMAAIQGLPALYREPFVLRHLSGWSYQEIADVMDMPVDSVETRLVRARRLLREALKDIIKNPLRSPLVKEGS